VSPNAVYKIVARTGIEEGFQSSVRSHTLRHGNGYQLASKSVDTRAIQAYIKNIQHTILCTLLNASGIRTSEGMAAFETRRCEIMLNEPKVIHKLDLSTFRQGATDKRLMRLEITVRWAC